jgi:hypothetical protein
MNEHHDNHHPDPMRPALQLVERQLEQRLEEACSMRRVSEESTGELMRLEETLLEAARAAKHAVSVRRRLRTLAESGEEAGGEGNDDDREGAAAEERPAADRALAESVDDDDVASDSGLAAPSVPADSTMRNFVDSAGTEWQVWEVTPNEAAVARSGSFLAAYKSGWLAFESMDGSMRRRLPNFPRTWCRLTDGELESLLGQATEARRRGKVEG